jgi:hypothetical protein
MDLRHSRGLTKAPNVNHAGFQAWQKLQKWSVRDKHAYGRSFGVVWHVVDATLDATPRPAA